MKEISRVLKSGGHFIATVPAMWPLHEEPHDYFRYTRYALQTLMSQYDLQPISIQERGGGILAIAQLMGAMLYDVLGNRAITRIPMKLLFSPLLISAKLLDRLFYYPKLTLGYTVVARKM